MKILFFTNEYSHPKLPPNGGVGTFFKTISKELQIRGHDVYIYGFSKKNYLIDDNGIDVRFFKQYSKSNPISELLRSISSRLGYETITKYWLKQERMFLAKKLKNYAISKDIDIIQSFTFNGFTAYWDNSIPLVTRYHGSRGFWHFYLDKPNDTLKIAMEKRALEITPYTVANSHFSSNFIRDYYKVNVDTVIPNGINTDVFKLHRNVKVIPKSIFYIGTISKAKGVDDLAEIFNIVIGKHSDATLHLIGRGESYFKHLEQDVLSNQARTATTYYSHVPFDSIPEALSQASIIAVPSKGETFGFTIVEAMALEKVTIVSNIPVAKEIINHKEDGFIAEDKDTFSKYISDVFNHPEAYDGLRKKARQKVLDNFTQELMTKRSIEYYEKILKSKDRH